MVWENNVFYLLFLNALTGSVAFLLSKVLIEFAKKYGSAGLIYNLLRCVLIFFAVPIAYMYRLARSIIEVNGHLFSYDGNMYTADKFHKVMTGWLIITSAIAIYYCFRFLKYRQLRAFNVPCFDDGIQELFCSFYPNRRLRRVCIFTNMMCPTPCIMGVIRPVLVLPEIRYTDEEMRIMLAHEATHALRRDNLWKLLARGMVLFCWWNPLSYWYLRRVHEWTETYCDETVCEMILNGNKKAYATTLASVVIKSKGADDQSLVSLFVGGQTLCSRVKRLEKIRRSTGRKQVYVRLLFYSIFILGTWIMAMMMGDIFSVKGEDVYLKTIEVNAVTAVRTVDLNAVDNHVVFSINTKELGEEALRTEDAYAECAEYGQQKNFSWQVEGASISASRKFLKEENSTVFVSCFVTFPDGESGTARVGVIEPDGSFTYALCEHNTAVLLCYTCETGGYYKTAVQNVENFDISAGGYYVR